jgi:hypothetical protein
MRFKGAWGFFMKLSMTVKKEEHHQRLDYRSLSPPPRKIHKIWRTLNKKSHLNLELPKNRVNSKSMSVIACITCMDREFEYHIYGKLHNISLPTD